MSQSSQRGRHVLRVGLAGAPRFLHIHTSPQHVVLTRMHRTGGESVTPARWGQTIQFSPLVVSLSVGVLLLSLQVYVNVDSTRRKLESRPTEITPRPELLSLRAMISMAGIGTLITLTAAYVIWRALKIAPDHVFQTTASNWDSIAAGVLLLLLGVFVFGVPLAGIIEHPLPRVQIIKKPEEQRNTDAGETSDAGTQEGAAAQEPPSAISSGSSVEGWLVAHTDSCWHLFVGAGKLSSYPDERVTVAHVYEDDTPGAKS
jgi:predicted membrane channel-forming protein YqfA (hemolysin III family)